MFSITFRVVDCKYWDSAEGEQVLCKLEVQGPLVLQLESGQTLRSRDAAKRGSEFETYMEIRPLSASTLQPELMMRIDASQDDHERSLIAVFRIFYEMKSEKFSTLLANLRAGMMPQEFVVWFDAAMSPRAGESSSAVYHIAAMSQFGWKNVSVSPEHYLKDISTSYDMRSNPTALSKDASQEGQSRKRMTKEKYEEAKELSARIHETLKRQDLSAEERKSLELHSAALSGVLHSTWLPVGWGRRLIMLGIIVLGIQQAIWYQNYQPFLYWLILPFFSPRIVGEVAGFLGSWGRRN